jgi:UDP-glucose 4-epimerase
VNAYGLLKQAAEAECLKIASSQLSVVVLRPTLVYGPFGELWTTSIIRRIVSGHLRQLGAAGEGNANLIYVQDLARFVVRLTVAQQLPAYSVFNVNGPEIPTFNKYFDLMSQMLGRGPLPLPIDAPAQRGFRSPVRKLAKHLVQSNPALIRAVSHAPFLRSLLRRAEARLRLSPSEGEIEYYGRKVIFSVLRANAIGFEPCIGLGEGIAASLDWARATGLTH